jgi:hypothetical protein
MPDDDNGNSVGFDDDLEYLILGVIAVLLLTRLAENLPQILQQRFGAESQSLQAYLANFQSTGLYTGLVAFSVAFSAVCMAGTMYAVIRLARIRAMEKRELDALTHAAISGEDTENKQWQQILSYAASDDEELWRLAIIEADVMLDEMLEAAGYPQDELGDKLRSAERSDFRTIDKAWEAHKLRNVIAHEGASYNLNRRELNKAINQYRDVFNEFGFI